MRQKGGAARTHSWRWVAIFSILLCISAAPVLADPAPPVADESSTASPGTEELTSALIRSEAEARARQEKLEEEWATPQAEQEREESQTAFAGISSAEAQSLLLTAFPEQIEALNADPGRVLSNLTIEKPLGTYGALVENEDGESSIVESPVPVQSEVGERGKQPVDLSLEAKGGAFVPANPLSELELPGSTEGQIQLQDGVGVALPAEDPHAAEKLGSMSLFYPETEATTDTLVAPLAGGVEVMEQIRSPESPEQFRYELSLPNGATLRPRSDGGAEVVSGSNDRLAEVPPPTAVDAQGRHVAVTMSVEGDSLVVGVPHRSLEVAYPILLDPSLWDTLQYNLNEWTPTYNGGPFELSIDSSGLHARSLGWQVYEPNMHGAYVYSAPGTSAFIEEAKFLNVSFYTHDNGTNGCGAREPHGYIGIYNASSGSFTSPGVGEWYGGDSFTQEYWARNGGPGAHEAIVGIGLGSYQTWIKCNHEIVAPGVTLKESDQDNPSIKSVSGVPSGWFDPQKAGAATIAAADSGFGVHDISIYDGEVTNHAGYGCSGVSGSRCSGEKNWTVAPPYRAGERTLEVFAEDPLGHTGKWTMPTKVDNQAPAVELSGQFAEATEEVGKKGAENEADENKLSFPVYSLKIKATDGLETPPIERQSGVKNILVYLDGVQQTVPWSAQTCPTYSCKKEGTYQLKLLALNLTAGEHKLKVVAEDQVGHLGEREIEFEYIPATGIDDEYVMQHFPLPDGEGNEAEEENPVRPELAVNVMNGNLVFRQQDVEVPGPGADLEVERFYNSQLPKAQNTEWGAGWTLAQSPELEIEQPKSGSPTDATMVEENGAVEGSVNLPTTTGEEKFDKEIQAVVTKEAHGYEIADESGETTGAVAFNEAGEAVELRMSGSATVEVESTGGVLSELVVDDPGTAGGQAEQMFGKAPEEPEIYAYSFGGAGTGAGNLSAPADTATDAEGNVWVADAAHSRVQEFNSKGEFVSQFGAVGTGNGQFTSMHALTFDAQGNLWVAAASRVQEFNAKGEYLRQFGSPGGGNGQFFEGPSGLAVDPEGHVWTLEATSEATGKPRLQEFSSEGAFLAKFEYAIGKEPGQLKNPQALAIDAAGNLWIADTGNNRVAEFSSKGAFLRISGSEGTASGQFKGPKGIATDASGNVWVADTGNNRIEQLSPSGAYLTQFGKSGDNNGQFSEPNGLTVDAKGNVWVADTANNRVEEIAAGAYVRQFGGTGTGAGNLSAPADTATDAEGNVWVADSAHNRVQEFNSKGEFLQQFGAVGTGNGQFTQMHSLATDAQGNLWVAAANRVQEFNPKGEYLRQFGTPGGGNGQFFEGLSGLAVDAEGHVWTLESSNELSGKPRLQEFSSEGAFLAKFEFTIGKEPGQLKNPQALAIDAAGNLWIADTGNNRIAEFNAKGEFLRISGAEGSGNGQFKGPKGIATDASGNVWVSDTGNDRVQQLSGSGVYLAQLGRGGSYTGQFSVPGGLTVDAKGNLWVADTGNDRIDEFAAGAFVRQFGGAGTGAGNLSGPADTTTDAEGNVWVADAAHNRVQEFNSKGEWLRMFGATGTGNGLFTSMHALAFDAKGNLWVAAANRVQEFNSKGEYLRQFGTVGGGNGQFSEGLVGLAVDPEGHVWTLESSNELSGKPRLQEFSAEGAFLAKFEYTTGKEPGQLKNPQALAIDAAGNLWVADTGNNRIAEFNAKGEFLRASGSEGEASGQFKGPRGIATDAAGNVWVSDTGNNRVESFASSGAYLTQFGKSGDNNGQFSEPKGLTVDAKGNVWVADTANDRVHRWQLPGWSSSTYLNPLVGGGEGTGEGQLSAPFGVVSDGEGNVWVADAGHNRIKEFDSEGEFIRQFGSYGSSNGQFNGPLGIALDSSGNLWVADTGNNRVQEFNPKGEYLRKFGTAGIGNGQFGRLRGVAVDAEGHVWTIEIGTEGTGKPRVQEFTSEGAYITQFGSEGSGVGQFNGPLGIAVDAKGNVWVADTGNKRIQEFNPKGERIAKFGQAGSEEGQLASPAGVAIGNEGHVWVADSKNNKISEFSSEGVYLRQFGTTGTDTGQLSGPKSVALDPTGDVWVVDSTNNRVQKWTKTSLPSDPPAPEPNPSVDVSTTSGLVSSVAGEAAGTTSYTHSAEKLTAVSGPKGNTTYEYDTAGRLKKVTLPKGTWGEVKYDSVGRVASVKTSIEGVAATTTYFEYSETPRRTIVTPEKGRATTYDIAADGSILKWWNSTKAPTIEPLEGSLWYQRGEVHPDTISPGDQSLNVLAKSVEGIASIQIVANGNQVVAEKTCEQNWEAAGIECQAVEKTYVTETENWPPGILQLEVIVTDREGLTSTQRFWDNIPYTSPPSPEEITPPTFEDIKHFREEFGLDLDLEGNERAINDGIFSLIADWHDANSPAGRVARSTWERWGVPLRPADVTEMEYREWYLEENASNIVSWAATNASTSYGGYRVDNRAGGLLYVGFTQNQAASVEALKASGVPVATSRIKPDPNPPVRSLESMAALGKAIGAEAPASSTILEGALIGDQLDVGAQDVAAARSWIESRFGPGVPISIHSATPWHPAGSSNPHYWSRTGSLYGGQAFGHHITLNGKSGISWCSLGFGAAEDAGKKVNGQNLVRTFVLTAGHCFEKGTEVGRWNGHAKPQLEWDDDHPTFIGTTKRRSLERPVEGYSTDGEAVSLEQAYSPPRTVLRGRGSDPLPITGVTKAVAGMPVCATGASDESVRTGEIKGTYWLQLFKEETPEGGGIYFPKNWDPIAQMQIVDGDSGGPVWRCGTGHAVGLISGYSEQGHRAAIAPLLTPERPEQTGIQAEYFPFSKNQAPGVLNASEMGGMHLTTAK